MITMQFGNPSLLWEWEPHTGIVIPAKAGIQSPAVDADRVAIGSQALLLRGDSPTASQITLAQVGDPSLL